MNYDPMASLITSTLEVTEQKAFQIHQSTQKVKKHL